MFLTPAFSATTPKITWYNDSINVCQLFLEISVIWLTMAESINKRNKKPNNNQSVEVFNEKI